MLSEDPSRGEEYVEIKAAIENAEMFSQKFSFKVLFIKLRQIEVSFLKIPKFRMECYPL